jgi:hypothetical protein
MQEELTECLGVVFSVLVAVAPLQDGDALYAVWRFQAGVLANNQHTWSLDTGKPSAPSLSNAREWHWRHWDELAQACRRREAS